MAMKTWYVELKRDEYFTQEVRATSAENAVDQVLMAAPGVPDDWTVARVERAVHRATTEPMVDAADV